MVSHIAAAVTVDHGNATGGEHVVRICRTSLGKYWVVFEHPDFIWGRGGATRREPLHRANGFGVGAKTQMAHYQIALNGRH